MSELSEHTRLMWVTLKQVAVDTLERKWRLGEYAMICQDGKPTIIGEASSETSPSDDIATRPAPSSRR